MVRRVCCIWAIIWVNWSMLSWEAMGVGVSEDGLEVSEADAKKVKGSEFLVNRPDRGEWTQMDS